MSRTASLPRPADFWPFVRTQAWASLFGIALLAGLILSRAIWQPDWPLARYDALTLYAIALQAAFLHFRLESWSEARVIALFHLTGTIMELFKTAAGSWSYPEPALLRIADVPLFSGFMYAAVGSYMVRVIRLSRMRFDRFPPFALHLALAVAIYVNFFAHHVLPDARVALFAATILLYGRTTIRFTAGRRRYAMPLPLAALLSSVFLWIAENIGTGTNTWVYAGQTPWEMVSLAKMGSWYLLLYVAFATVTLVLRGPLRPVPARARSRPRR